MPRAATSLSNLPYNTYHLEVGAPGLNNADAADLRGERVAKIITVQVERGDDLEFIRARENLLQRDVRDAVLEHEAGTAFAFGNFAPRAAVHEFRAVFSARAGSPTA